MRRAALVVLLCFAAPAPAQEPPAPQSLDQLLVKLADLRKQRTDLEKQEAAVAAEIRTRFKELQAQLEKLGLLDPPAPKPPDPKPLPSDPLRDRLKIAFDAAAGTAAQKREWSRDLGALYRAAAKLCADPSLGTASQLKTKLAEASKALIGEGALREVRQAVAGELALVLPTTEGELTGEQRTAAAALFELLAKHLEELGAK